MALARAAGVCRLALRAQWAAVRLLGSTAASDELPGDGDKRQRIDLGALRRERALRPPAERGRLAPNSPRRHAVAPTQEQLQLNRDILACATAEAVLDLVTPRLAVLNEVNASTALMNIVKRVSKREAATWLRGDPRFVQLLHAAKSRFVHMGTQSLSNTLYACGQCGFTPPGDWLRAFWDASAPWLGEFKPQEYSNALYACGQLGITPPSAWLQRFWEASCLKLEVFRPQHFSNSLYACAQLRTSPSEDWLRRYWHASAASLPMFCEQNFANVVYACGQLGLVPPAHWLQSFWEASAASLGMFKPQGLSNTIHGCCKLDIRPPADWLQRFWHSSASKLDDFKPQSLSNTLYACGQLGITPPTDWLQSYWHAGALKLSDFKPQDLSNTLYACRQLGVTPPADWLQRYWDAGAAKLGAFKPQEISNTLLACAHLVALPPANWLEDFSHAFERLLPDANFQDLANTALALATLGLWELPLWPGLWERLRQMPVHNAADWSATDRLIAMQLYQALQAAAVERPGLLPAPSPELLAAARKSWGDGLATDMKQNSTLHDGVSACLTRMGVAHVNERWCERAERRVDIAIEGAGAPVAMEVDGPHHFLQDGRQDGSTQLRNRMLAAHGWRVVVVDYRTWSKQSESEARRQEYLRRLLADV